MPFRWDPVIPSSGLAWREAGAARDVVLIHGLGMSSAYFARLARALHVEGCSPIAPDLAGFGRSLAIAGPGVSSHLRALIHWADALQMTRATWVGHSVGCSLVAEVARLRPDLVARCVFIGPLWSTRRWLDARSLLALAADGLLENSETRRFALGGIGRSGVVRWLRTWFGCRALLRHPPVLETGWTIVRGERDPFRHHDAFAAIVVPGAHACHVTHPAETARAILA